MRPKTKAERDEMNANRLASALVDRLISNEKRLDAMQKELESHFEMIAEIQPKLMPDGRVTLRAFKVPGDDLREFTVSIRPLAIEGEIDTTKPETPAQPKGQEHGQGNAQDAVRPLDE